MTKKYERQKRYRERKKDLGYKKFSAFLEPETIKKLDKARLINGISDNKTLIKFLLDSYYFLESME